MARRESALLWGYSGWRMCYSVVCVKMCGKCWLTHRCCRHMETQQIRLEGCPGSLLSPHRYLPPGGTWAGNRSSSQGCPGCPCLLTSEPESEQRIGDNWVSLSDSSQSSGSLWVSCVRSIFERVQGRIYRQAKSNYFPPFQSRPRSVQR